MPGSMYQGHTTISVSLVLITLMGDNVTERYRFQIQRQPEYRKRW